MGDAYAEDGRLQAAALPGADCDRLAGLVGFDVSPMEVRKAVLDADGRSASGPGSPLDRPNTHASSRCQVALIEVVTKHFGSSRTDKRRHGDKTLPESCASRERFGDTGPLRGAFHQDQSEPQRGSGITQRTIATRQVRPLQTEVRVPAVATALDGTFSQQ